MLPWNVAGAGAPLSCERIVVVAGFGGLRALSWRLRAQRLRVVGPRRAKCWQHAARHAPTCRR
jgi:hypothetical protein